ncbi:MAG: hypothetical protein JSS29_01535 [Proteobacteria bacterium]|nr:hypothetical protein [Pseudomonadota bacterium]
MTAKTNSARRVYEILAQANAHQPQKDAAASTLGMWAAVLGADLIPAPPHASDTHTHEDVVLPLLTELRSQIRSVERSHSGAEDYDNLIAPLIAGALHITATNLLNSVWQDVRKQHISQQLVPGWGLLARSIADTEETISTTELAELAAAINELEHAALAEGIPESFRAFALDQVRALRAALVRYRVSGVGPLRKALATGVGELRRDGGGLAEAAAFEPERSKGVLNALGKVWTTGARVCGDLEKYQKAYALGQEAATKAHDLVPLIKAFLTGPTTGS